jgi:septal ring-binding cell division protein DamX
MLEGEISQIQLIERLVELWREQFTGAIRFENDGIIKIIYFKGGDVLSASTNDRADSIDEILMKAGKVSREHVKQALARRKESETLGDAMLNLGYITRKELTWARRVQVVGVIRSIAAWTEGSFTIVADYLPKRDEGTLFPLPQILVELIVTEQDRQKFDRALSGGSAVLEKAGDFHEVFGRLGLNEDAEAIVAEVDGVKSAAEVASASGRDAFNVYKLLQALATLRILTTKPQVTPEFSLDDDFSAAGMADASDMWAEPTLQEPQFEFDEANAGGPTLEVPNLTFDADETAALSSSTSGGRSAWDEADEEPVAPAPPPASMPSWDTPPSTMVAPIPVPVQAEPPADATEEQWGFDEAQIETARRAAEPAKKPIPAAAPIPRGKVKEGGKRLGLLIALLVVLLLAGAAYGGFWWWQKQQDRPAEPVVVARKTPAPVPPVTTTTAPPAQTGTIVELPATATVTETTASNVTATTTTQAPEPMTITPAPTTTVATATTQPLPVVRPRTAPPAPASTTTAGTGRGRYDELARQHAANPQGNFTVQIQILCDTGNLEKAMRAGGDNVWFVPQPLGERSCYRVYWGRFNTRDEAQRALANVPASLRDRSSAVKAISR